MAGIEQATGWIITLVMAGMIGGAGVIALNAFQGSTTAGSDAYNTIGNFTGAVLNLAKQLPTVGTIMGVSFILLIVVGVFAGAYIGFEKFGGGGIS